MGVDFDRLSEYEKRIREGDSIFEEFARASQLGIPRVTGCLGHYAHAGGAEEDYDRSANPHQD